MKNITNILTYSNTKSELKMLNIIACSDFILFYKKLLCNIFKVIYDKYVFYSILKTNVINLKY